MSNMRQWRFVIAIMIVGAIAWMAYTTMRGPTAASAPTVVARLIDGDTGQPVAGAKVKYTATIEKPHAYHGYDDKIFYAYETVTDADGRFVVPAWGPKPIPHGWYGHNSSPWVEIEKESYNSSFKKYTSGTPWQMDRFGMAIISAAWANQQLMIHKIGVLHPANAPWDTVPWDNPH